MNKIKEFLKAILIVFLFFLGYNLLFLILYFGINFFIKTNEYFIDFISSLTTTLCLFLYYRKTLISQFQIFKKNYKQIFKKYFKYYIYGILIMMLSNFILFNLTSNIATNEEMNRNLIASSPFFAAITVCFLAPFYEEILFRLGFRKAFNKKITFAIITGLIFGSLHLLTASSLIELLYIIPYSSVGVSLGLIYFESNNIFSSIMFHVINNSFAVLTLIFGGLL